SPEMVPLNRAGAGWFAAMLRRFEPQYVVERPGYLLRNRTLISEVPMFRTAPEREEFLANYQAIAEFGTTDVPRSLLQNYRFAVYARRTAEDARRWREQWWRLDSRERGDLTARATTGPVSLPRRPAAGPA